MHNLWLSEWGSFPKQTGAFQTVIFVMMMCDLSSGKYTHIDTVCLLAKEIVQLSAMSLKKHNKKDTEKWLYRNPKINVKNFEISNNLSPF